MNELRPWWAKDAIVVDTDIHLSFWDAVRVLWKRKLSLSTKTFTEVESVGRIQTLTRLYIEPWRRRPPPGIVAVEGEKETP